MHWLVVEFRRWSKLQPRQVLLDVQEMQWVSWVSQGRHSVF